MPKILTLVLFLAFVSFSALEISAQTTDFTFQGSLKDNAVPASGNYDFEFALFDMLSGGSQIGSTIPRNNVVVTNGIFAVTLDFGNQFTGALRYMEIRVRLAGQPGITILGPRQLVNSAPYSVKSLNADNATNATNAATATNATNATTATNSLQLGGVAANQYVVTTDPRMTNARAPTAGSANYIQNNFATQPASFNIGGNGTIGGDLTVGGSLTLNIVNATTQFNIAGNRVLSVAGTANTFAGISAGTSNTSGSSNSFFGNQAGLSNISGISNSFFGRSAGQLNTASSNSFFGAFAGDASTTGGSNAFFGTSAGGANTTGSNNVFVGREAGFFNTTGSSNTALGNGAGVSVGFGNLTFATAIGAGATVADSNSIVLGRSAGEDIVRMPGTTLIGGNLDVTGRVGVGTLGSAGLSTHLCLNGVNDIAYCSSSLRYKTNVQPFIPGLSLIKRLKPITFNWKEVGTPDMGLGAEDVADVEPLLVTYNKDGQIEGVKYDRIGVVAVNAINEQQAQIEALERQNLAQQKQIEALTLALCSLKPELEICKQK